VRLEKHADVRIGDHARKNVPPGFVSWKYVQDSIAGGELCNIDDYKIGTSAPRPVGSAQPTRATRNPFTAEEDRQLTEYVLQKTHEGRGPTGNKVFEVFAEQVCCSSKEQASNVLTVQVSVPHMAILEGSLGEETPPGIRKENLGW